MSVNSKENIKNSHLDVICRKTTVVLLDFLKNFFLSVADCINGTGLLSLSTGFVMNSLR